VSIVRDPSLAELGERKIRWVAEWMPVLNLVRDRLANEGTVAGRRMAVILPVEPKTAYLAAILAEAGAEVSVAFQGVMVHDDVAAGLAARGVEVFAQAGSSHEDELRFFEEVLARRPEVVIDDRADVIRLAHTTHREVLETLIGASEETTSGVVQLRAMEADGTLEVPCIAANDARCKYLFDNRYGTGQSSVNAVLDRTNLLAADKDVVVVGYGWVGKGIAARLKGLAARVTVCEVEPFAALEAYHDGFDVAPLVGACRSADLVISGTGVRHTVGREALEALPDGALLANAGAVDDEIDVLWLRDNATETRMSRDHVEEFVMADGRSLYVVGAGVVVNLSAGEGHPAEIMDLTFAVQALSGAYLMQHGRDLEAKVHTLPAEIDEEIARMKLDALGVKIDTLTPAQEAFLQAWEAF
jgi:adenosylhomocysteinase